MARSAPQAEQVSTLRALRQILDDLPGLVSDRAHLFALESKRCTRALAYIVMLGAAAALLGFTVWVALWVGVAAALIEFGIDWWWALLLIVAVNAVAIFVAVQRILALVPLLTLPATMRQLTTAPSALTPAPDVPASHAQPAAS